MLKDRFPKGMDYVPPMDEVIKTIGILEKELAFYKEYAAEVDKKIAKLNGKVDKIKREFELIRKYID